MRLPMRLRPVPSPGITRATLSALTLATTFIAGSRFLQIFDDQRAELFELLLLLLFVISFCWLALSFWSAVGGFVALGLHRQWRTLARRTADLPPDSGRTAILMPIHNEDAGRVFARLQAMFESLQAQRAVDAFEFFVLSDSTDPDAWIAEEAAWRELCRRVGGDGRIFYRKRRRNTAYKSGNIADFCRRWGGRYEYMIVLDADSLMTAETLVALVHLMNDNPKVGLIQVPPTIVNAETLFARLQQFASRLYGPVFTAGTALWHQGDGNYWGHNAIIRVAAFTAHCGLPDLPGRKPFGGHIMSHDFVEAALLRRAGWQVWMVPWLGGSYEETPPTLIDHAKRDRRWCQGNLQHMRVLPARGLHPISRLHLFTGIMSYLTSPLWLAFLAAGIAFFAWRMAHPPVYFPPYMTLFPMWPKFDASVAIGLAILVLGMLLLPRLLGLVFALASARRRLAYGGALRLTGSFLFELTLSALMAPILMLLQSGFVTSILGGRSAAWRTQRRDGEAIGWREACVRLGWQSLLGTALTGLVANVAPELIWWLVPLLAGLVLAVPLTVLTTSRRLSMISAWLGLLWTPEETEPPPLLVRARELEASWRTAPGSSDTALHRLAGDPALLALHLAILPHHSDWQSGDADMLIGARDKLALSGQTAALTSEEVTALLFDPPYLEGLAAGRDLLKAAQASPAAEPLPAAA
ncbi:MAG: glucans biosynthesis glucosyltransferase MdoH [Dongiaceae bacterium]